MKKVKNLDLIIILVAITILGIITAIVLAIRPYEVKKFDKITHVNIDNYKTIKNNKEETGMFGINMHRASINGNNNEIGLYSAGCQVHQDYKRFTYEFMPIIKSAIGKSSITYTLINEDDL